MTSVRRHCIAAPTVTGDAPVIAAQTDLPRAWRFDPASRTVSFGRHRFRLSDVATVEPGEVWEPNVLGHLMAVALFLGAGSLFILPVALTLAAPKFLIGGGLFVLIGVSALTEIFRGHTIHLHWIDIRLTNGETVRFTTDRQTEAAALTAVLQTPAR